MVISPLPTLFLVCEQEETSHQIYTQHFGFTSHSWRELSSYLQEYAKQANYISRYDRKYETANVVPLLRRGLLVKDGDAVIRKENGESSESSRTFCTESNEGSSSSSNSSNKENDNSWTGSKLDSSDEESAKDEKQGELTDGLSEYERLRLRNIKRSHDRLAKLGLLTKLDVTTAAGARGQRESSSAVASTRQPRRKKRPFAQISPRILPRRRVRAHRAVEDCTDKKASQDANSGHCPRKVPGVDANKCTGNTTDRCSTRKRPARCLTRGPKGTWSEEEDAELRKRVRLHGVGKWKDVLDKSSILQERYAAASGKCIAHADCSMRMWFENNQTTEPLLYFSITHVQPNRHKMPSEVAGKVFGTTKLQARKVRRWLVLSLTATLWHLPRTLV